MKKLGAEFILGAMFLPWAVYMTLAVFNSQKVEAVQETKYQMILERLEEIKSSLQKFNPEKS